jgi:hypothetical protein
MKKPVSPTIDVDASEYAKAVWEDESPAQGGQLASIRQETRNSHAVRGLSKWDVDVMGLLPTRQN